MCRVRACNLSRMRIARIAHPEGMCFALVEGEDDGVQLHEIEGHPFGEPDQFFKEEGTSLSGDSLAHIMARKVDIESIPEEVLDAQEMGRVTDYNDWRKIDQEEIRRGEKIGKERERMNWEEARAFLEHVKGSA